MTGQEVVIRAADGGAFGAYLALPAQTPAPGVVVLQEIFGLNAFVRAVVERLAAAGFAAIAPDLFWRQEPGLQLDPASEADRQRGMQLLSGLDEDLAVQDCVAVMDYLRSEPAICSGKVGTVGYCLGGKLAYLMSTRSTVDASVGYYGVGIHAALAEAGNIRAPLLLHIADADHLCPPENQEAIAKALAPLKDLVIVKVHPGAGHGFARAGGPTYNAEATANADQASLEFLQANLLRP